MAGNTVPIYFPGPALHPLLPCGFLLNVLPDTRMPHPAQPVGSGAAADLDTPGGGPSPADELVPANESDLNQLSNAGSQSASLRRTQSTRQNAQPVKVDISGLYLTSGLEGTQESTPF
jgi:hypothetical protein